MIHPGVSFMVNQIGRSTRPGSISVCALLFLVGSQPLWCDGPKTPKVAPDAKIQATLRTIVTGKPEDDKVKDAMRILDDIALRSPELLAPQIIYYSLHVSNEKEAWNILGVMKR